MSKTMLIDAAHAEETRVAIVDGRQVEEFDFESTARRQLRGNIYLAKVTRVEPSLQAAFVEYGGNRHGFLAFNEIHPDYYQIPVADREAIMAEAHDDEDEDDLDRESTGDDVDPEAALADEERLKRRLMRRYKIQDVIKRRQILLVQVVKDERGAVGLPVDFERAVNFRDVAQSPVVPKRESWLGKPFRPAFQKKTENPYGAFNNAMNK